MANMRRSRTGDWSVVIGPGLVLALGLGLLYIFVYIFSSSSLVRVVANLRRCLHYHIIATARVLPKATQRELFRLGAYPRYSQSHYRQRYFSEL